MNEDRKLIFGMTVGWFVAIVLVVLGVVLGSYVYLQFKGDLLTKDFQAVKHSQPFVESTNTAMRSAIVDYTKAETEYNRYSKTDKVTASSYQGEMKATLNQIYALAGSLSPSEVAPDVQTFLASHPQFGQ